MKSSISVDDLSRLKPSEEFKKENFVLHFDSIFSFKEIRKIFELFTNKTETKKLLFLENMKELKKITEKTKEIQFLKAIIEEFFLEGSTNELVVSKKTSNIILELYETLLIEKPQDMKYNEEWLQNMNQILSSLEKSTTEELKHHSWSSFMRTDECEMIMKKNYKNPLICSPQITQYFSYNDEYFLHPFIFENDFHFADLLFKDNFQWNLLKSDDYNAYVTFLNFLPHVKNPTSSFTAKYEWLIPLNFHRLAMAYHSRFCKLDADTDFKYYETLAFHDHQQLKEIFKTNEWEDLGETPRSVSLNVLHSTLPFPMNPRIYHHSMSAKYNPEEECIIVIGKPYVKDDLVFSNTIVSKVCLERGKPMKKSKIIPFFNYSFFKYKKINENNVLFTQVLIADFGGWTTTDESLTRKMLERRGMKLKETFAKMDELFPKYEKLEEIKDLLCAEDENGNVIDGVGKMLYELLPTK
jgi:hypothetical protein